MTISSPLPDIVRVRIEHFTGGIARGPQIPLAPEADTWRTFATATIAPPSQLANSLRGS